MTNMRTFLYELIRRKVFRVAVIYVLASWLALMVIEAGFAALGMPEWSVRLAAILLLIGLPVALWIAWSFEVTPAGLRRTRPTEPDEAVVTQYIHHFEIVLLGAALIVIAYFVWSGRLADEPPPPPPESVIRE